MKSYTSPRESTNRQYITALSDAIIAANESNDWSKVTAMMNNGYSLLWEDYEDRTSVTRELASNPKTSHVIPKLLNFSKQENGIDSQAHRFILIEAAIGCLENGGSLALLDIASYAPDVKEFYNDHLKLAEMGRREIGHLVFDGDDDKTLPRIQPSAETVFHLCRGHHYDLAEQHLSVLLKYSSTDEKINAARAYLKGLGHRSIMSWDIAMGSLHNEIFRGTSLNTLSLILAEAVITGNDAWVLSQLDSMKISDTEDYDGSLFGECIISAARAGRTDIILKLNELARKKKLEKNPKYQELLSMAAGAAIAKEQFTAAKVVMSMTSRFDASEHDMIELCYWPVCKIKRLSHALNNYKLFTEVVSRVDHPQDKLRWISALKEEYGLQEMSDNGFLSLLEHPEGLQKLFHDPMHKYNIGEKFMDHHLSEADLDVFNKVMVSAKTAIKARDHGKVTFFRLCHLAHKKEADSIKPAINEVLIRFMSGTHLPMTKKAVRDCQAALRLASDPAAISKALRKHLKYNQKLLNECLALVNNQNGEKQRVTPSGSN